MELDPHDQISSLLPQFPSSQSATSQLLPFEKSRPAELTSKLHQRVAPAVTASRSRKGMGCQLKGAGG